MFAELSITSNFTFLTGASHPEEYMERAALLGIEAIAIADDNSVAGIVRAYTAAKQIARQVAERQALEAAPGIARLEATSWAFAAVTTDGPGSTAW